MSSFVVIPSGDPSAIKFCWAVTEIRFISFFFPQEWGEPPSGNSHLRLSLHVTEICICRLLVKTMWMCPVMLSDEFFYGKEGHGEREVILSAYSPIHLLFVRVFVCTSGFICSFYVLKLACVFVCTWLCMCLCARVRVKIKGVGSR